MQSEVFAVPVDNWAVSGTSRRILLDLSASSTRHEMPDCYAHDVTFTHLSWSMIQADARELVLF